MNQEFDWGLWDLLVPRESLRGEKFERGERERGNKTLDWGLWDVLVPRGLREMRATANQEERFGGMGGGLAVSPVFGWNGVLLCCGLCVCLLQCCMG